MYYQHSLSKLTNVVVGLSALLAINAAVLLQRTPLPPIGGPGGAGKSAGLSGEGGLAPDARQGAVEGGYRNFAAGPVGNPFGKIPGAVPGLAPEGSITLKVGLEKKYGIVATDLLKTEKIGPTEFSILEAQRSTKGGGYKADIKIGVYEHGPQDGGMAIFTKSPEFKVQVARDIGDIVIPMYRAKLGPEESLHRLEFPNPENTVRAAMDDAFYLADVDGQKKTLVLEKPAKGAAKETQLAYNRMIESEAGRDGLSIISKSSAINKRGVGIKRFYLDKRDGNYRLVADI